MVTKLEFYSNFSSRFVFTWRWAFAARSNSRRGRNRDDDEKAQGEGRSDRRGDREYVRRRAVTSQTQRHRIGQEHQAFGGGGRRSDFQSRAGGIYRSHLESRELSFSGQGSGLQVRASWSRVPEEHGGRRAEFGSRGFQQQVEHGEGFQGRSDGQRRRPWAETGQNSGVSSEKRRHVTYSSGSSGSSSSDIAPPSRSAAWYVSDDRVSRQQLPTPPHESVTERLVAERPSEIDDQRILPSRPSVGTSGSPLWVEANCWDCTIQDVSVLIYDITVLRLNLMTGKVIDLRTDRAGKFVKAIAERRGMNVFSDGGRILYSLGPLNGERGDLLTFSEIIRDPNGNGELTLECIAKKVGSVSPARICEYISSDRSRSSEMPQNAINMLGNLIKWVNRESLPHLSKSSIFSENSEDPKINCMFRIHTGHSLSFRPQLKCRLNVDMAYRAFARPGNLARLLTEVHPDDVCNQENWKKIEKQIRSLRVEACHYRNGDKQYKRRFLVYGLSKGTAEQEMIPDLNKSVAQYFRDRYGIVLEHPDYPCVKTRKDRDEYIPMELLEVLPFQNAVDDAGVVSSSVIQVSAVSPKTRFNDLKKFINSMKGSRRVLRTFGVTIPNPDPVKIQARVLPAPCVRFHRQLVHPIDGAWIQGKFYRPVSRTLRCKVVIMSTDRKAYRIVRGFQEDLRDVSWVYGLKFQMDSIGTSSIERLPQLFADLKTRGVELAIFVLSKNDEYPHIKRHGDLYNSMFTQCIKLSTIGKSNVLKNLMLKINAKMGGTNWRVTELPERWKNQSVMVVGADVTHPGPTGDDQSLTKSVAAVVASISSDFMRYVAIVRQQDHLQGKSTREEIDGMKSIFTELLKTYRRYNNNFPSKVIVYRDGVSEGQFTSILRTELLAMQEAYYELDRPYLPLITFTVVQKRHHIRFNPLYTREKNILPGTVVDDEVTHPREFDFYLCSHQGIQGTSKPAHYHVLYDDNNFSPDDLQSFTYYLCHAYMRCCRSVSYPAPTYYSHLAAFRARNWLKGLRDKDPQIIRDNRFTIHPGQRDQMFFL